MIRYHSNDDGHLGCHAEEFSRVIKSGNYANLTDAVKYNLPFITLDEGCGLRKAKQDLGMGSRTIVSAYGSGKKQLKYYLHPYMLRELKKGAAANDILYSMPTMAIPFCEVPFTCGGIMDAWLIENIGEFLPRFWHCKYADKHFIFTMGSISRLFYNKSRDIDYIYKSIKEQRVDYFGGEAGFVERLVEVLKTRRTAWCDALDTFDPMYILPCVTILGKRATLTYCYWSDWQGLVRCTLDIRKYGRGIDIVNCSEDVLINYEAQFFFRGVPDTAQCMM